MTLIVGDLASSCFAGPDSGFRVRPRIVNFPRSGEERRASTTASPCLPVAPVARMTLDVSDMDASQGNRTILCTGAKNCKYQIQKKERREKLSYVPKLNDMVD